MAQEQGCRVISHESIYRFIYAQIKRTKDYSWRQYLPRKKSKRGYRGRKGGSSVVHIKDRVSIHERDPEIEKQTVLGHWEADLMLFSKQKKGLLVLKERSSRLVLLFKLQDKSAKPIAKQIKEVLSHLTPALGLSVTFDNGTEFSEHHQLNQLGIKTYFCDVRSPWQKGSVENAIGRLRRYLPRQCDIGKISQKSLENIMALYNHTPRKCLGYKTPAEFFLTQLLHFKCEFTSPLSLE